MQLIDGKKISDDIKKEMRFEVDHIVSRGQRFPI